MTVDPRIGSRTLISSSTRGTGPTFVILRVDSSGARTLYAQFTGADNYSLLVLNPGFTLPPGGGPGGGGGGGL